MSRLKLDILIEDARWRRVPRLRARLLKAAEATHAQLPKRLRIGCTLTVLLTSDAKIRRLNRNFRGFDKATNVLSFPQFERSQLTKMGKRTRNVYMGDIALGYQYIVGEAEKTHKILINHATHLLIHGVLHLFGYDHGLSAETVRMERLEQRIMAGLGLPGPYAPEPKGAKAR